MTQTAPTSPAGAAPTEAATREIINPATGQVIEILPEQNMPSFPNVNDAEIDQWLVADLLGSLPALERELLQLRFYDELSQTEIAAQSRRVGK